MKLIIEDVESPIQRTNIEKRALRRVEDEVWEWLQKEGIEDAYPDINEDEMEVVIDSASKESLGKIVQHYNISPRDIVDSPVDHIAYLKVEVTDKDRNTPTYLDDEGYFDLTESQEVAYAYGNAPLYAIKLHIPERMGATDSDYMHPNYKENGKVALYKDKNKAINKCNELGAYGVFIMNDEEGRTPFVYYNEDYAGDIEGIRDYFGSKLLRRSKIKEAKETEVDLDDVDPFDLVMDTIVYNDRQVQVTDPKTGKTSPRVYHGLYDYDKVGVTKDDTIRIVVKEESELDPGIQFAKDYEIEWNKKYRKDTDEWILELDPWTVNVEKLYPDRNKFITGGMYKKGGKPTTEAWYDEEDNPIESSEEIAKYVDKLVKMGISKDDATVYVNTALDAGEDLDEFPYDWDDPDFMKEDVRMLIDNIDADTYGYYLTLKWDEE